MFKIAESIDANQVSITGIRSIIIIGILSVMPRSFEELKGILYKYKLMDETSSDDILKVDLATIKYFGCEIESPNVKNGGKYVLKRHPFSINFSEEEIKVLKKAYSVIKQSGNIQLLLEYDYLFKKLSSFIFDEEIKEALLGISVLKRFDVNLIKELILDCAHKRFISFYYKTPIFFKENLREGVAQELTFNNGKLYLYIRDYERDVVLTYNVARIKTILSRKFVEEEVLSKYYKVLYYLKNSVMEEILENEKIVEYNENGFLIEGKYLNSYWAAQRIMNFGSRCKVVEPAEFKEMIVNKLEGTKRIYEP